MNLLKRIGQFAFVASILLLLAIIVYSIGAKRATRAVYSLVHDSVNIVNNHQLPQLAPNIGAEAREEIQEIVDSGGMGRVLEIEFGEYWGIWHLIVHCDTGKYQVTVDDDARLVNPFARQGPTILMIKRLPD